jgi:hypothetical protein
VTADPLAPLLDLADVPVWLGEARERVDRAMRHGALRRRGGRVAAEVGLRSAAASAALEGHRYAAEELAAGTVPDPVAQGALRVAEALVGLADRWPRAPFQVLARLHVLAARGVVPDPDLGRPATRPDVSGRLGAVSSLVARGRSVDPMLLAAVVHGELLTLPAFDGPYGVVARATARLTLISSGLDPRGLLPIEVGHLEREPEYRGARQAFATGSPDGVRSWLRHCATAVGRAADELAAIGDEVAGAA